MFARLVSGYYRQHANEGAPVTVQPAKAGWLRQMLSALFGKRA